MAGGGKRYREREKEGEMTEDGEVIVVRRPHFGGATDCFVTLVSVMFMYDIICCELFSTLAFP